MKIKIDTDDKQDLSVLELFLLELVNNKCEDIIDETSRDILIRLEEKQLLKVTGDTFSSCILRLDGMKYTSKNKEEIKLLAEKIRNLFPEKVKSGGYIVRSNLLDIIENLDKFKKKYKYSDEIILKATEVYIDTFRRKNWEFLSCAKYFIMKQNKGSILAEYCDSLTEKIKEGCINYNTDVL